MAEQPTESFSQKLRAWRPDLRQKEKAAILGVALDTFRGWIYNHSLPRSYVQQGILALMREHDAQSNK